MKSAWTTFPSLTLEEVAGTTIPEPLYPITRSMDEMLEMRSGTCMSITVLSATAFL